MTRLRDLPCAEKYEHLREYAERLDKALREANARSSFFYNRLTDLRCSIYAVAEKGRLPHDWEMAHLGEEEREIINLLAKKLLKEE